MVVCGTNNSSHGGAGWRLEERELLAAAEERSGGLTDLGGEHVLRRFRMMVRLAEMGGVSYISTAPDAKAEAEQTLIGILVGRLQFVADEARYPRILEQQIERPLVVMGIARSGTTLLHSLLSANPDHRAPRYWELRSPSPPPSLGGRENVSIQAATDQLRKALESHPGAVAAHPYFDQGGMTLAECEWIWKTEAYLGGYMSNQDADQYAFHRTFLQHLQYGAAPRRWVLKGTLHQYALGELLDTYPDAALVWIHRDPVKGLASAIAYRRESPPVPTVPPAEQARDTVESVHAWITRTLESPLLDRVHHVLYRDLIADPVTTVRGIYDRAELPYNPTVDRAVRDWLAAPANRSDRHGRFRYALEDFDLTETELEERFAPYKERFGIPSEGR